MIDFFFIVDWLRFGYVIRVGLILCFAFKMWNRSFRRGCFEVRSFVEFSRRKSIVVVWDGFLGFVD